MKNVSGKIKLDDRFYIYVDPYCWALLYEVKTIPAYSSKGKPNKCAGKQITKAIGYYRKLEHALDKYVELKAKESLSTFSEPISISDVKTILSEIKNATERLAHKLNVEIGGESK